MYELFRLSKPERILYRKLNWVFACVFRSYWDSAKYFSLVFLGCAAVHLLVPILERLIHYPDQLLCKEYCKNVIGTFTSCGTWSGSIIVG